MVTPIPTQPDPALASADDALAQVLAEMAQAEQAPEPTAFTRGQVIHSPSEAHPVPIIANALFSAGHVYVYDRLTGDRSVVNRNMFPQQLRKINPDTGELAFRATKPPFEPPRGQYKCLLHRDIREPYMDEVGFVVCRKSNIISPFEVQQHMRFRHPRTWETIRARQEQEEKEKDRELQRALIAAVAQQYVNEGQEEPLEASVDAQAAFQPKRIRATETCPCGKVIGKGTRKNHERGEEHRKWLESQSSSEDTGGNVSIDG